MQHLKSTIFSVFLTMIASCTTTGSKQKPIKTDADATYNITPNTTQANFEEETRQMCISILEANKEAAKKNQSALCKMTSFLIAVLNYAVSEDEESEIKTQEICEAELSQCLLEKIESIDTKQECRDASNWRTNSCDISLPKLQNCLSTFHQVRTEDINKFAAKLPECKELTKEFFKNNDKIKRNPDIEAPKECCNIIKKCHVLAEKIGLADRK